MNHDDCYRATTANGPFRLNGLIFGKRLNRQETFQEIYPPSIEMPAGDNTMTMTRNQRLRPWATALFALLAAFPVLSMLGTRASAAETSAVPGAPMLLPEETMVYLRITSVEDIREGFGRTALGRMTNDPKMRPFVSELTKTIEEAFQVVSAEIGIELEELLAIPQGQVAFGLVPQIMPEKDPDQEDEEDPDSEEAIKRRLRQKTRAQFGFAVVLIVEAKENMGTIDQLLEKLEARLPKDRLIRRTESIDDTELVRWVPPRVGRQPVEYFKRDGAFVIGVGQDTAKGVLNRWVDRGANRSFANNGNFTKVMSQSVVAEDSIPQVTFYVDPFHIFERLVKGNGGAAALAWPIIESLGVGKIRGIGGSAFRGGEYFDDISHVHVVIDTPRDGFFGVLRPATGDTTPPDWVPSDISGYSTIHWDFEKTLENLGKILDKFNGEGSVDRFFEKPLKNRTGLSLNDDIIPNLTGRYVGLRWLEPPMRINSQINLFALELTDAAQAQEIFDAFRRKLPELLTPVVVAGQTVYTMRAPNRRNTPKSFRQTEPMIFLLDDWIIFSDSKTFVQRMMLAKNGNIPALTSEPDYELVVGELGGKLEGRQPFFISYLRSSEVFRQIYELAQSPDSKRFLKQAGADNPIVAKFSALIDQNELPSFSEFEKYFGAGGMCAYNESGGMHLTMFNLKPIE